MMRKQVLVAGIAAYLAHKLLAYAIKTRRSSNLRDIANTKRQERDASVGAAIEEHGLSEPLTPREHSLIALSATELLSKMRDGSCTCVEITRAFIKIAATRGMALGHIAEERFADALRDAAAVDEARASKAGDGSGEDEVPLYGLPISVKDQFNMAGYDSTCGLAVRCGRPAAVDGALVSVLRKAGAIPFVRTNVPQALLLPETGNAVWGVAQNPYNVARTTGGSSGGEGGILALGGSPCGLGTDIGGSLRIPAHNCGVCALKPTAARLTKLGLAVPRLRDVSGQDAVKSTAGPMARCVAVSCDKHWRWVVVEHCASVCWCLQHALSPSTCSLFFHRAIAGS